MSDGTAGAGAARATVMVIEDDAAQSLIIGAVLRAAGLEPLVVRSAAAALAALEEHAPDAACLDINLPDMDGGTLLLQLRERRADLPVVMVSAQASVQRAVEIMKLRPFDYFEKPFDHERFTHSVQAAVRESELRRRLAALEREVRDAYGFDELVGNSAPMRRVYDLVRRVLDNSVAVFIHGESGTGKELVARAIHHGGSRRGGPFVTLNCGAIPEGLQESTLFGHEKGAFTGAAGVHRGTFEQAHRGTLFLDEVGELSPAVQTRLLRVLAESKVQRVGGAQEIAVDVRIVAATHRDLEALVREGRFREDLFYRLVVFPLELPPLRERRDDIAQLAAHFVRKHQRQFGGRSVTFDRDALDVLCRYDWPGNVRELENVVLRTLVASEGEVVHVDALPPKLVMRSMGIDPAAAPADAPRAPDGIVPLVELERQAIVHALRALDGNVSLVAKRLGLGRSTLYRKLAELGLADGKPS